MYALTREGRKPPMVHVRQSIYSLLQPVPKKADSVNILGYFAPLEEDCELRDLLKQIGVKQIREISSCEGFSEFEKMAEANFNLILNPEARPAAGDLQ
jgi:nitrogenase molybdenum-cofactor synthesis protein NifE